MSSMRSKELLVKRMFRCEIPDMKAQHSCLQELELTTLGQIHLPELRQDLHLCESKTSIIEVNVFTWPKFHKNRNNLVYKCCLGSQCS